MNKLEELEKQYAKLGEEIEKLKKGKEEKYFVPEKNERYYALVEGNTVDYVNDSNVDEKIFARQMVYRTEAEAEFYDQKRIYETQYRKHLLDHEEKPVNWEDREKKYSVAYNYCEQKIKIEFAFGFRAQGTIYTTRKESITEFIEEIGEDNFIKYILIGEYKEG